MKSAVITCLVIICHVSCQPPDVKVTLLKRKFTFNEKYIYSRNINNMGKTCQGVAGMIKSLKKTYISALNMPLRYVEKQYDKEVGKGKPNSTEVNVGTGCNDTLMAPSVPKEKRYAAINAAIQTQEKEFEDCFPKLQNKESERDIFEYRKKVTSASGGIVRCLSTSLARQDSCSGNIHDEFISKYYRIKQSVEDQCINRLKGRTCATAGNINEVVNAANQFLEEFRKCIPIPSDTKDYKNVKVTIFEDLFEAYDENKQFNARIDNSLEQYIHVEQEAYRAKLTRTTAFFEGILRTYVSRYLRPKIITEENYSRRKRDLETECSTTAKDDLKKAIKEVASDYKDCDNDIDVTRIMSKVDEELDENNLRRLGDAAISDCIQSVGNRNSADESQPILSCYNRNQKSMRERWERIQLYLEDKERDLRSYTFNGNECERQAKEKIKSKASKINDSYLKCLRNRTTRRNDTITIGEIEINWRRR